MYKHFRLQGREYMKADSQNKVLIDLIALAKEGDKRAYGKVFRLCYRDIYDYILRRVRNRFDAEDLTMQVFMRGMVAVSSYEERGRPVKAWLFRIAHNSVVDHFRAQVQKADLRDVKEIASEVDIESGVILREKLGELQEKVMLLPQAQLEVITLRFLEDMSVMETASILDKKEVTVRALQFKGIRNLRDKMDKETSATGGVEGEKAERK